MEPFGQGLNRHVGRCHEVSEESFPERQGSLRDITEVEKKGLRNKKLLWASAVQNMDSHVDICTGDATEILEMGGKRCLARRPGQSRSHPRAKQETTKLHSPPRALLARHPLMSPAPSESSETDLIVLNHCSLLRTGCTLKN